MGHFGHVSQSQSKNLKLTQQKDAFTNQKKCNTTQNKHEKLMPGLVAFYDIRPGNGALGLFSKENINKEGIRKTEEKKDKWGSIQYKQANNIHTAKIKNLNQGRIIAQRPHGLYCSNIASANVAYSSAFNPLCTKPPTWHAITVMYIN